MTKFISLIVCYIYEKKINRSNTEIRKKKWKRNFFVKKHFSKLRSPHINDSIIMIIIKSQIDLIFVIKCQMTIC